MLGGEALGMLDMWLEQDDPGWGYGDLPGCSPALLCHSMGEEKSFPHRGAVASTTGAGLLPAAKA